MSTIQRSRRPKNPARHKRTNLKWGRIQLLVLFAILGGLDAMLYFGALPKFQHQQFGTALVQMLWATVCVAAMWKRQNWGRYVLFLRLIVSVVLNGALELSYGGFLATNRIAYMVTITLGNLLVAIILIASPQIRKLTKPDPYSGF